MRLALLLPFLPFVVLQGLEDEVPPRGLPARPVWGTDTLPPKDANSVFATSDGCAHCHGGERNARTLVDARGTDVTPHGTWRGSMMAHSFRDPYFRAQLEREVERAPEREAELVELCTRCHAPMAAHTARLSGEPLRTVAELDALPLAQDGVSCTVCHQVDPAGLGTPETFHGRFDVRTGRRLYGPYYVLATGPMQSNTAFVAVRSDHVGSSALCGSCHVLGVHGFLEQATYLEWRNSQYQDEVDPRPDVAAGCGDCHVARVEALPIERPTQGFPFDVSIRPDVHSHAMVGGNAFLLDLLARHREELGLETPAEVLRRAADATRVQLRHRTASLEISNFRRDERLVRFDVTVRNETGHKFPSGYPSRRAWLDVEVRLGRQVLLRSGAPEPGFGGILEVDDGFALSHVDHVSRAHQVQVYEMVAEDATGAPTTVLSEMARVRKDNRLLPIGWREDGPHARETAPVGTDGDDDFGAGADTVTYAARKPARGRVTVVARLWYQAIAPHWADGLADSKSPAADRFYTWYYKGDPAPETVAVAVAEEPREEPREDR